MRPPEAATDCKSKICPQTKTDQARIAQAVQTAACLATTAVTSPRSTCCDTRFAVLSCAHATSFLSLLLHTLSKSPTSKLSTPMPPPCLSVPHRTLDPPNGPKTSIVHTAPSRDVKWNPDPRFSRPPGREAKRPPMHCMRGSKKRAARRLLVTGRPTRSWVLTRDRPRWRSLFGTSHLHFRYRSAKSANVSPLRQEQ